MKFKLHAEFDENKRVFIKCPKCHIRQELPINSEWYDVNMKGEVHPIFVCMEKTITCDFEGMLWIVNYDRR